MKKTIAVLLAVIFSVGSAFAQQAQWKNSRHSVFAGGGINVFMGDLGGGSGKGSHFLAFKDMDNKATNPSFTIGYKYKLTERFSLRANVLYSIVKADDASSENVLRYERNFNFKSNFWDLGGSVDFYFIKEKEVPVYARLSFWKRWSAYVFVGLSGLRYNPKGQDPYTGDWVELRPLHTEGQTTGVAYQTLDKHGKLVTVESEKEYGKWTLSYPFGIGVKCQVTRRWDIGLEFAQRYTFSDHLDDCGSDYYFNYAELGITPPSDLTLIMADKHMNENGEIDPEKYLTGRQGRSNSDYRDAYWTLLLTLHYKFKSNKGTPYNHRPKYM